MKRLLLIHGLALLLTGQFGCSKDSVPSQAPEPEPVTLNKDSVIFASHYPMYVSEAYRYKGKDSVDIIKETPLFATYRNGVSLQFFVQAGYINFWSLSPRENTEFTGNAMTFSMQIRTNQPTGLEVAWDDTKGTLVVQSTRSSNYFPMILLGKKAYLEAATFRHYRTWKEAQAAKVKPRMVFVYEDEDPKHGKVMYKITLKPLYEYYREEYQQNYANFVTF